MPPKKHDNEKFRYTLEQRKFILKTYWKTDCVSETQKLFQKHFGITAPHRNSITYLVQKFEKHGTVKDVHKGYCGRPKAATSSENEAKIIELSKDPTLSIREMARATGISRSSVNRILKNAKIVRKQTTQTAQLDDVIINVNDSDDDSIQINNG